MVKFKINNYITLEEKEKKYYNLLLQELRR
ncbi:hypothetical protein LCGC14_1449970 [marine sediment metagenome]|uniref:Uncharacterized protein n=1 Tax=marine sediment metagenome TaxID=412755 RepID=A0A0F9MK24_9ZZZZ